MERFTQYDEFGNADIIGVDSEDLQCNLCFEEFNKVTAALNRLAKYEDLVEHGKLLKLPCAVGDMAYRPDKFLNRVFNHMIKRIEIDSGGIWAIDTFDHVYSPDNFGKTVFLIREEAEAALKRMEADYEKEKEQQKAE